MASNNDEHVNSKGENNKKAKQDNAQKKDDKQSDKVEASSVDLPSVDESKSGEQKPDRDLNLNMVLDVPVDIRAELGNTSLSIGEILKLGSGSIIELDRSVGSTADIIVNGKLIGQGDVVVVGNNFGIRITKLVGPEERLESL
jgi:flagellar motor switch protein FliN